MFPTSDVAKQYCCARTKTSEIVGEMANHAQECIKSSLKQKGFSVAIDGSNDSHSQLYSIGYPTYVRESGLVESTTFFVYLERQASGRSIGNLILEALASFHILPVTNV